MKKVIWVISLVALIISCNDDMIGEDKFTGVISEYTNNSFNFFGYQLKDVSGFERHPIIDGVQFKTNGTFQINGDYKIVAGSNCVTIYESKNPPVPFTEIINKGSSIVCATRFKENETRYALLSGIKNNKTWFGKFDIETKEQLQEWTDTKVINRNFSEGYSSNLSQFYIKDFYASCILKLNKGYGVTLTTDVKNVDYDIACFVLADNQLIQIPYHLTNGYFYDLLDWDKEHYLLCQYDASKEEYYHTLTSPEGNKVETIRSKEYPDGYPINFREWLSISLIDGIIMRKDFNGNKLWRVQMGDLVSANYLQSSHTLLNKDGDVWQFSADIVHYDSSRTVVGFKVNINTGEVKLGGGVKKE